MATPRKLPSGRWTLQIQVGDVRESNTLNTKREIEHWGAKRTIELRADLGGNAGVNKTLRDALRRYVEEVSPTRRGYRWEVVRLHAFEGADHRPLPILRKLGDLTPQDIALWRDARLTKVARSTVLRDLTLLSAVFEVARREWRWVQVNPVRDVAKPSNPDHRERTITGPEIRRMLRQFDLADTKGANGIKIRSVSHSVGMCFLLALQTGMRAGELCALRWDDVFDTHCKVHSGKTGKRDVPLTPTARRVVELMRGWDDESVFGLKSQTLDALFRRARVRAGLDGFTFHDARHTAATRLAHKLHVLDLCKVFGWSNTTRALTYFNPKVGDLAKRMA